MAEITSEPEPREGIGEPEEGKTNVWLIVAIVAAVLILLCCCCAGLAMVIYALAQEGVFGLFLPSLFFV